MSDLTRDEIRGAVESVPGWEWVEEGCQAFARDELGAEYFLVTETPDGEVLIDYHDCDGDALLDAAGPEWIAGRINSDIVAHPYWAELLVDLEEGKQWGIDRTTAAVRAVNQWTKTKKETTP